MTTLRTAAQQALEALEMWIDETHSITQQDAITALRAALAQEQAEPAQEPVAWTPIEQPYPQGSELDILMGDGSILCSVLPQYDGDLWWEGSGTGEKFIDPKYANVTHWRIHSEHTATPQRKPLPQLAESQCPHPEGHPSLRNAWLDGWEAAERAHGIGDSNG